jgi:hypothetical protein
MVTENHLAIDVAEQVVGADNNRAALSLAACNLVNKHLYTATRFELE